VSSAGTVSDIPVLGLVYIDASIGRETKFIFDYGQDASSNPGIAVVLTNPNASRKFDSESKVTPTNRQMTNVCT
jgi:hypothetical protein